MLTNLVLVSFSIWFAFFLINYAEVTGSLRNRVAPFLWARWPGIAYVLSCPLCLGWWILVGYCVATVSFTPLLFAAPPCVLILDLVFNRLRDGCN